MTLAEKAERLRALHHERRPLILPNAWDAASARVLAEAGFEAIATGSSGVAASLGHPDGEGAPVDDMFAAARRIAGAAGVPVTVDVEAGYGLAAGDLVARLVEAGGAGCNIEDTDHERKALAGVEAQAERLAAVRKAADAASVPIVINARVDVFTGRGAGMSADERLKEAVKRGRAYLDAGADCVYPILASDEAVIAALVERIPGPVNVLYGPGAPSLRRLAELGVARVTFGGGLHRATMVLLTGMAKKILGGADPY